MTPIIGRKQLKQKVKDTAPIISKETVEINKPIKVKKKSKVIAIFLNIFSIGFGYLYVGNIKKALLFSILFPIFIYTQFYIATIYSNIYTVILNYSLIVLVYIYSIYDVLNIESKFIKYNKWYFMIVFYVIYIGYIFSIQTYIPIKYLSQSSNSMSSTIIKGDSFIINVNNFTPNRGDITIFKYPQNQEIYYVKRCVAKGGDLIALLDKHLFIRPKGGDEFIIKNYPKNIRVRIENKLWVRNPYKILNKGIHTDKLVTKQNSPHQALFNMKPILIPDNTYFMMGDNRDHSNDSRFWGTVPQQYIVGKVKSIYVNFNDISRSGIEIK